jgi:hypothetical protein
MKFLIVPAVIKYFVLKRSNIAQGLGENFIVANSDIATPGRINADSLGSDKKFLCTVHCTALIRNFPKILFRNVLHTVGLNLTLMQNR